MAGTKSQGNVTVSYNSVSIAAYCNKADLQGTLNQLDVTTLGDTGKVQISDVTEWKIALGGPWAPALDTAIAPDAVTPGTKRTAVIAFTNGASTVTYTWTSNAEVQDWQIQSSPDKAISWTATLVLSGAPTRTVA